MINATDTEIPYQTSNLVGHYKMKRLFFKRIEVTIKLYELKIWNKLIEAKLIEINKRSDIEFKHSQQLIETLN
jgi:hypothetical protein